MSRSTTVSYELVRLPKHSLELAQHKRKTRKHREEIDRLRLALKTCKAKLAEAQQKGFSHD